jgi:hypothetical protein
MTADLPTTPETDPANRSILFNSYQRARFLLTLAAVIAFILFWFIGRWFGIPFDRGYDDSLLLQKAAAMDFLLVIVGLFMSVNIGTIIAGPIRYDAGLCTACLGLLALSVRGGPIRYVLFADPKPDVYLTLLAELILLFLLLAAMAFFQKFFHTLGWLRADAQRDGLPDTEHLPSEKFQAAAVQVIIMAILIYFLAATDRKFQVLCAVAIASFVAAMIAHSIFPVRPSAWFWVGPLIVGAIGYIWAYAQSGDWLIGASANPLARPLPLDYASVGPAAAIVGYWMSRRWHRDRVET